MSIIRMPRYMPTALRDWDRVFSQLNSIINVDSEKTTVTVDEVIASNLPPQDAAYVTLAPNDTLSNERSLAVASGELTQTDNGAGSTVELGLDDAGTAGTYTKVTTDAKGRVVTGTTLVESDIPSEIARDTEVTAAVDAHEADATDVHAAADYAQTDVTETISVPWYFADNIVLPKTSGKGIQLEPAAPTFGWRDIIGQPQEPTVGSGKPSWVQIASSGVYTWSFATADIQYYQFHIPHDYVPGSAVHFHVHWFSSTTAGASTRWTFDYLYAKGHQQAAFPTTATSTFAQQVQVTTAYTHMIAESAAETISGLEVDGLILVKVSRVAPTGGPSDVAGSVFVPCIDLHYQSTNLATKQKAPPFWT